MDVVPSGPEIVTTVGVGVRVTVGGNLMGSRPIWDTNFCTFAEELNERAIVLSCVRGSIMPNPTNLQLCHNQIFADFKIIVKSANVVARRRKLAEPIQVCTYIRELVLF